MRKKSRSCICRDTANTRVGTPPFWFSNELCENTNNFSSKHSICTAKQTVNTLLYYVLDIYLVYVLMPSIIRMPSIIISIADRRFKMFLFSCFTHRCCAIFLELPVGYPIIFQWIRDSLLTSVDFVSIVTFEPNMLDFLRNLT